MCNLYYLFSSSYQAPEKTSSPTLSNEPLLDPDQLTPDEALHFSTRSWRDRCNPYNAWFCGLYTLVGSVILESAAVAVAGALAPGGLQAIAQKIGSWVSDNQAGQLALPTALLALTLGTAVFVRRGNQIGYGCLLRDRHDVSFAERDDEKVAIGENDLVMGLGAING